MIAEGAQGTIGELCIGALKGLKLTCNAALANAKSVRIVVDSTALKLLTTSKDANLALRQLMPEASIRYDVDLAICQGISAERAPTEISQLTLSKEHDRMVGHLVEDGAQVESHKALTLDIDHMYSLAGDTFWLLNKVHQCVDEASALSAGYPMGTRVGRALQRLIRAHNDAHARYPDEMFVSAAETLAFSFVKTMGAPALVPKGQANYMAAAWPVMLWARAASVLPGDAPEEARVLLHADNVAIGAANAPDMLESPSSQGELSHDILQTYLASLQLRMPIAKNEQHLKLLRRAKAMQAKLDDKVAAARISRDMESPRMNAGTSRQAESPAQ